MSTFDLRNYSELCTECSVEMCEDGVCGVCKDNQGDDEETTLMENKEKPDVLNVSVSEKSATLIKSHANDVVRGDLLDLNHALNAKLANNMRVTAVNPDDVFDGDFAEVTNVSFRPNDITRLTVKFGDSKFNLTYNDDTLLIVQENEQDTLKAV